MNDPIPDLVQQSLTGDRHAFAELIRTHERMALALAYNILHDPHAAGDVVQDAFLRAWQRLSELQDPARFPAWLATLVRNAALDARRKLKLTQPLLDDPPSLPSSAATPEDDLHHRERSAQITAALAQLDDTTRAIVLLRYFDNTPSKRIAELLHLSPAAIDMRLARAKEKLRLLLPHPIPK